MNSSRSGFAERTFWISGVASESGGVQTSSTTSWRPFLANSFSFSALAVATEVAGVVHQHRHRLWPLAGRTLGKLHQRRQAEFGLRLAVAAVWKMYLKPRSASRSE